MATRGGTKVAIILTAIVTAAITSAVWLLIFNLADRDAAESRPVATAELPRTMPASAPVVPGPAPEQAAVAPPGEDDRILAAKRLTIPVSGIAAQHLTDMFGDVRGGGTRNHEALDIMAPRGTPVVATEDGVVAKLFESAEGGLTIYQFDPTQTYSYYYAHLDRYADGIAEGRQVRRGQVIGYVGSTGNASPEGPHLHFAIFRLGADRKWHEGTPINPFPALGGRVQTSHTSTLQKQ
jgi:murein DD-endopeptidase MepM/ murein hydrolase activator NlpD